MPLHVTFELSDSDLDYFRKAMREAHEKVDLRDEAAIIAGARRLTRETTQLQLPISSATGSARSMR